MLDRYCVGQMSICQMYLNQMSGRKMSVCQCPLEKGQGAIDQMSVDQKSVSKMSVDQKPVDQMSDH
jgi:hypothetical protein